MMPATHFSIESLSHSDLSLIQQNSDINDFDEFDKHQLLHDEDDISSSDLSPSHQEEYIRQLELNPKIQMEFSSDDDSDEKSFPLEPSKIALPAPFMFPSLIMYPPDEPSTTSSISSSKSADEVTVVDGVIYNSKGYEICGALNKFNKPCQRIGKNCPFHNKAEKSSENVVASVPVISSTSPVTVLPKPAVPQRTKAMRDKKSQVKKEPYKRGWTKEEHMLFLKGLQCHGKGSWKDIASFVGSRSPSQIQVHAHRYFLRQQKEKKAKRSIHDFTLNDLTEMEGKQHSPTITTTCSSTSQSPISLSSIVANGPPTSQFVVPSPIYASNGSTAQLIMTSNPNSNVHTSIPGLYASSQATYVVPQQTSPTSDENTPQHSPYATTATTTDPTEGSSSEETPTSPATTATATFTYLPTTVHTTQTTNGQTVLIPINQFPGGTTVGWLPGPSAFPFTQNSTQAHILPSFIHVNQQGSIIFPQSNLSFLPQYAILPFPANQNEEDTEEDESEEEEENNQFAFEQNETDVKSESEDLPDIFLENKL